MARRASPDASDLTLLRKDLEALAGRLGHLGERTFADRSGKAAAELETLQDAVDDALERIGAEGRRAADRVSETVQEHPRMMLLAASRPGRCLQSHWHGGIDRQGAYACCWQALAAPWLVAMYGSVVRTGRMPM